MVINWYGEGCFKIQTGGIVILTDPFDKSVGLIPPRFKTDITIKTISDYPIDYTLAAPDLISGPGEYEIKGVEIKGFPLEKRGKFIKTVYLVKAEGLNLGFWGHVSEAPDSAALDNLSEANILFLPAGGAPYLETGEVLKIIKQAEPQIVVPSFFKIPGLKSKSGELKDFLKEIGQDPAGEQGLTIKKKDLPEKLRLVVLKP